jgi:flavodoxin I
MKVLILYDSFFGNTERIARSMGDALASAGEVQVSKVGDVGVEVLAGVELLIAGSPTRGFRPSDAMKIFLKSIPADGLKGIKTAAFDTRIAEADIDSKMLRFLVKFGGYADRRIAGELKKKGVTLAAPSVGFFVKQSEGPLKDGELERAADWARLCAGI